MFDNALVVCASIFMVLFFLALLSISRQEQREYIRHLEEALARWERIVEELRRTLYDFPPEDRR